MKTMNYMELLSFLALILCFVMVMFGHEFSGILTLLIIGIGLGIKWFFGQMPEETKRNFFNS